MNNARLMTTLAGALAAASAWGQCEPLENPIPEAIAPGGPEIGLQTLTTGLTAPIFGTWAPGDLARMFVVDQMGIIWAVSLETGGKAAFFDDQDRLVDLGVEGPGSYDERGLLGLAFHPDYMSNGLLYVHESRPVGPPADFSTMPDGIDPDHQAVISEWHVPNPGDPGSVVDPLSVRELLRIDKPQFNHNGGTVQFGPDGMLYISLGDGGAGDDQGVGHKPGGNAQNLNVILGKVLRIDPQGNNSKNGQYGVPKDNPFVGKAGLDEIFAYGFRNPYRFSFDMEGGDLWLGDAGQHDIEEVDIVTSGGNYGWRWKEGSFFFSANGDEDGFVCLDDPGVPDDLIDPVAEYDHDEGEVVVGGFVYHGDRVPGLQGLYVFGDYVEDEDEDHGRLFHLDDNGQIVEFQYADETYDAFVLGFGQDAQGEVYILGNHTGTPFEKTGFITRLTSDQCLADCDANNGLDLLDFLCFQNGFNAGDVSADCDANGVLDLFDFLCFVNAFNAGC